MCWIHILPPSQKKSPLFTPWSICPLFIPGIISFVYRRGYCPRAAGRCQSFSNSTRLYRRNRWLFLSTLHGFSFCCGGSRRGSIFFFKKRKKCWISLEVLVWFFSPPSKTNENFIPPTESFLIVVKNIWWWGGIFLPASKMRFMWISPNFSSHQLAIIPIVSGGVVLSQHFSRALASVRIFSSFNSFPLTPPLFF